MEPRELVSRLGDELALFGVDVVHPLALVWYNSSIPDELGARIPSRGPAGQDALSVLVGNSRAVWEPFLEALAHSAELQAADNPLELYLEQCLTSSLAAAAPGLRHRIYWSHRRTGDLEAPASGGPASEHVAFQRMAHHSGLAYLDHDSHLCLHPRFGPWFSLRCVIIFDELAYTEPKPRELPHPLPLATQQYVRMTLHAAVHSTSRRFSVSRVDVEAAEAALAEAAIEPRLQGDSDAEEEGGRVQRGAAVAARGGSSSTLSSVGSDAVCSSGGSTPAGSSGRSSPSGSHAGATEQAAAEAASQLTAPAAASVPSSAEGAVCDTPPTSSPPSCPPTPPPSLRASLGSPAVGSPASGRSRHASPAREMRPSMRAVNANWRAWVAVRDSPCPGHPMRYSEEQIRYHYTRSRTALAKALLRRNLGPGAGAVPSRGLSDPALCAYHKATCAAQKAMPRRTHAMSPIAPPPGGPDAATPSPITAP